MSRHTDAHITNRSSKNENVMQRQNHEYTCTARVCIIWIEDGRLSISYICRCYEQKVQTEMVTLPPSSLAKGYDPLYSSSPLASLDGFLRSHGDGLYVMQLVVAATNQNGLYKEHMFCRKNVKKIKMRKIVSPARF